MQKYNYAIYHKNCLDGFTSLIILLKSKQLMDNSIVAYDMPSTDVAPNGIDNKNVIIMDVAYKYNVLREIVERAKYTVFIDHHVTISEDVKKISEQYKDKLLVVYDLKESGASLTWSFLFKKKKMPLFIRYIKDNDIGEWKLKHTISFIYAIKTNYDTKYSSEVVNLWFKLFDNNIVKSLIKRGKIYSEYANNLLEENSKRYSLELFPSEKIYNDFSEYFTKPGQYKVAVFNGGCPNVSLLGNKIVNEVDCDFALIWTYNMEKKEYIMSLRSKDVDVGKIANIFGGGGHKFASALSIPANKYIIQDLFFKESLPRY
ncbi:putative pAp phosphatase [Bodo saltans virus]|uniref:PAp phosphatase n=1 Tax=Bodo saltans virus TaxID=2024608 RepID=A0A2H4UTN5_9VIRU|nr:putative pAp phosphatase [Bodo saltans virus]ATZ80313.1 putative pAp phosphatase [Bodo saltans virus]